MRCSDVAFTCPLLIQTLLIFAFKKRQPCYNTGVLCTCAISKASSSCPLPVKKVTSFFMSPVAMQYGIASSLSSAISWSALLHNRRTFCITLRTGTPQSNTLNLVLYLCMSFFQYFMDTPGATDNAFSH